MNPKVSIVIPVYNGANYLREAIDSALAQTYQDLEILVIDDGSTDDGATEKIAKSYGDKIKYFKKPNGGVATALNLGIKKMAGDYFSWLSHDDMYEIDKIEEQIKFLKSKSGDNLIVACNAKVLFSSGLINDEKIDKQLFDYFDIFLATAADIGVNGCSLLIPRVALIESNGFDPNLPVTQDYDLWFRLNKTYRFALLEKSLVISRRHGKQDSVLKQAICLEAGDKLHYDFLNEISYERFEEYIQKSGMNKTWGKYILYKNVGYVKTASMLLKIILEYFRRHDDRRYKEVIKTEIGEFINLSISRDKEKKRVLFYNNVWCKGGIAKVLMYIFNSFSKKYDLFLATLDDNEYGEGYDLPKDISYIKISNNNQHGKIMNILSFFEVDVFVGTPNFFASFLDIYKQIKGSKTKTIAYNAGHYFLPYMYPHLYPTAIKIKDAYNYADAVIWLSQIACNMYNFENSNGVYLPNPVTANAGIKPKNTVGKNLLAVGRFDDEIKRIDRVLLIFKEVLKEDPDYHLDIVGSCPTDFVLNSQGGKTTSEFLEGLNFPTDKIKFWGNQADVSKFYQKADFLIMPSTCEGFGMVLTEALSFGVPCACSDYLGIEEIIQEGGNGWSSNDDVYLAKKIIEIGKDLKKYRVMSKNALNSVKKYNLDYFCDGWELLVESLVDRNDIHGFTMDRPTGKLSQSDYKKIILGYENFINDVANNYINKGAVQSNTVADVAIKSRFANWIDKFKISIKEQGVIFTLKRVANKVYRKTWGSHK